MNDFIFNLMVRGITFELDGDRLLVKGKVNTVLANYIERNHSKILATLRKQND